MYVYMCSHEHMYIYMRMYICESIYILNDLSEHKMLFLTQLDLVIEQARVSIGSDSWSFCEH